MDNLIRTLVARLNNFEKIEDCVVYLESEIENSGCDVTNVQYVLTALQTALRAHARNQGGYGDAMICSFCGKTEDDARCIVTSSESAICDECTQRAANAVAERLARTGRGRFRSRASRLLTRLWRAMSLRVGSVSA
jgi:hypothetical protein